MNNRKTKLYDIASEMNIKLITVTSKGMGSKIGIHLLNPNLDALEDALQVAERDGFTTIYIHSNDTFKQ